MVLKPVPEESSKIFLQRTSELRKTETESVYSYQIRLVVSSTTYFTAYCTLYAFYINQRSHFKPTLNHQTALFRMSAIHCTNSLPNNS